MKSTPSCEPLNDLTKPNHDAAEFSDPLLSLARGLKRGSGFSLFFAVCNKPVEREALIQLLTKSLPELTLERIDLNPRDDSLEQDPLDLMETQLPHPKGPVLVTGLEKLAPMSHPARPINRYLALEALNFRRPEWPLKILQPVVFWIPEYLIKLISRHAPDFWAWRSKTLHFPDLPDDRVHPVIHGELRLALVDGRMTDENRRKRVEELRQRVHETQNSNDSFVKWSFGWHVCIHPFFRQFSCVWRVR